VLFRLVLLGKLRRKAVGQLLEFFGLHIVGGLLATLIDQQNIAVTERAEGAASGPVLHAVLFAKILQRGSRAEVATIHTAVIGWPDPSLGLIIGAAEVIRPDNVFDLVECVGITAVLLSRMLRQVGVAVAPRHFRKLHDVKAALPY